METQIMKVLHQGETQWVESQKAESGKLAKCSIVLQCIGGKFEDSFVATLLGNPATCMFASGSLVAVNLRFAAREYQGQYFQDVVVSEIINLNKQ